MDYYYRTDQREVDRAFGDLSLEAAAALIAGDAPLTDGQRDVLNRMAGGGQYALRFDPDPVGHVGFHPVATGGCGNQGWHVLVPATPECRRRVNQRRRQKWAEFWAEEGLLPKELGAELWALCRGHEPTLEAATAALEILRHNPCLSDRGLRDAGLRPGHPVEGDAIWAVREVLQTQAAQGEEADDEDSPTIGLR